MDHSVGDSQLEEHQQVATATNILDRCALTECRLFSLGLAGQAGGQFMEKAVAAGIFAPTGQISFFLHFEKGSFFLCFRFEMINNCQYTCMGTM